MSFRTTGGHAPDAHRSKPDRTVIGLRMGVPGRIKGNGDSLRAVSARRSEFAFTPKHGSWPNIVAGFFSKLARSVLRHIRVASKHELKQRIIAAMDEFNRHSVVHTWSYKLDNAA